MSSVFDHFSLMRIFNEKTVINYAFPRVPDKAGYLLKKRTESKRSFKRRYFVLHGNILTYSETKRDKEPLGVIFLEGHFVEFLDENAFAIRFSTAASSDRAYVLQAENPQDAESWMQALTHCGSEFLTLSVEELEDYVRSLSSLASPISQTGNDRFPQHATPPSTCRNPFNHSASDGAATASDPLSHIAHLLSLSWDDMQASARSYLDETLQAPKTPIQELSRLL